jgi:hypothetical protein
MEVLLGMDTDEVPDQHLHQGWRPPAEEKWAKLPPAFPRESIEPSPDVAKAFSQAAAAAKKPLMKDQVRMAVGSSFRQAFVAMRKKREVQASELLQEKLEQHERPADQAQSHERLLDYAHSFAAGMVRVAKTFATRFNNMRRMPTVPESFAEPAYQLRAQGGDEVLRQLRSVFSRFPDKPTKFQWMIFDATCCAAKALIYGEEYFGDPNWVLERNGWSDDNDIAAVLTGRKTGKSTGLAMTALSFMFVIPGFRGVVGSRTLEQALIIPDLAKQLISRHPDFQGMGLEVRDMRARYFSIGPASDKSDIRSLEGEWKEK